ncbi:MAG TPA: response regulator transcription factor [Puia sp.]|nr:response regulator transcription factor [Puia sp.]
MSYKVLYVEDEPFLARIVSDGLKSSGYTVHVVSDGNLALGEYHALQPDICVLDIMLPSRDGYEIAAAIRAANARTPILFLSAKTLTEDVIKGFRSGGHDYLKKPFSMDELLIRMESLVKRFRGEKGELEKTTVYRFGHCHLDTLRQILTTSSGESALSFKEMALLEMMILHKNTVLERKMVLDKIWGEENYYNTRSMDVFLTHLRKLLKDEPGIQILNVRGIGYKFIC